MNIMSADLRLKKELKDLECAKREIEDILNKFQLPQCRESFELDMLRLRVL